METKITSVTPFGKASKTNTHIVINGEFVFKLKLRKEKIKANRKRKTRQYTRVCVDAIKIGYTTTGLAKAIIAKRKNGNKSRKKTNR